MKGLQRHNRFEICQETLHVFCLCLCPQQDMLLCIIVGRILGT